MRGANPIALVAEHGDSEWSVVFTTDRSQTFDHILILPGCSLEDETALRACAPTDGEVAYLSRPSHRLDPGKPVGTTPVRPWDW